MREYHVEMPCTVYRTHWSDFLWQLLLLEFILSDADV
jgi:hypothetical protein